MTEEPTQRIRRPEAPGSTEPGAVPPLPGGLDPLYRPARKASATETDADSTGVLRLDEIFEAESDQPGPANAPDGSLLSEAPTWTAMPMVSVRSEPYPSPGPGPAAANGPGPHGPAAPRPAARRLGTDLAKIGDVSRRQIDEWLRRDDNALMLLTSLIACILILIVAAVGH